MTANKQTALMTTTEAAKAAYDAAGSEAYPFRIVMADGELLVAISPQHSDKETAITIAYGMASMAFPTIGEGMDVMIQRWDGLTWQVERNLTNEAAC
jgi:hypothetical protein